MPPAPYSGSFALRVGGSEPQNIQSFAGCYDTGAIYEPCRIEMEMPFGRIRDWINESLLAPDLRSDHALIVDSNG